MKRLAVLLVSLVVAAGLLGSCSEQPLEPAAGPNLAAVDSVQLLAARAAKSSPMLTDDVLTACGPGLCTFTPTDYQCGGDKVECSTQTEAVEVAITTPGLPTTLRVFGDPGAHGAVLCNGTMGTIHVFDELGAEVDVVPMVPTEPEDCGPDNLTYAAEATIQHAEGIGHIVIEPMSPFTFPLEGGTGIASAFYRVQYAGVLPLFTVSCTPTLVRGATGTCTVQPTTAGNSLTISRWRFLPTGTADVVQRSVGIANTTWGGQFVVGGTVEVVATVNGQEQTNTSASVAVTPRDWSAVTVPSVISELTPAPLPIQPTRIDSQLGLGDHNTAFLGDPNTVGFVTDQGPNQDMSYFLAPPFKLDLVVMINRAAMSTGSAFYNLQVTSDRKGTGPDKNKWWCGRPRMPQLLTLTEAHEGLGSTTGVNSHSGIWWRVADRLTRLRTEALAGVAPAVNQTLIDIDKEATDSSKLMDLDPLRNNLVTDAFGNMKLLSPTCQFKFFP